MEVDGIKIYKITKKAYFQYRTSVKGNRNIDIEVARLKLSRNILLAKSIRKHNGDMRYFYGNLIIDVRDDLIIYIKNGQYPDEDWEKHNKKHLKYSKKLKIPMEV